MSSGRTREQGPGIVRIASNYSVGETIERLAASLKAHSVLVFAHIDFSGDAKRAGLAMRPEQMLIFGNPRAGTPLMLAEPTAGLDLPLKALVWEDTEGEVWLAYNDPGYILSRHALPGSLRANLAAVAPLLQAAAQG
jgi:uncharacterized protein (DUF302 family)